MLLHRHHANGAIVESAGEQEADYPGAKCSRCRAEEWVNRGTVAILAWPAGDVDPIACDEHVLVGRGHVDPARLDLLPVHGV
jgi:hypothetical protein